MTQASSSITCVVCGESDFESGIALTEHRSEKHFYKCLDCDKEYKLTDSLRKHVKVTHNENVTMTCCKYCDKVLMDPSQKSSHLAAMHADVSSNEQRESNNSSELNLHRSDQFQCPCCSKHFSTADGLLKHARMFHNISVKFCQQYY